jgi:hypothetical protein
MQFGSANPPLRADALPFWGSRSTITILGYFLGTDCSQFIPKIINIVVSLERKE